MVLFSYLDIFCWLLTNFTWLFSFFFFSSRRRHTSCALVTGVQTCALPICPAAGGDAVEEAAGDEEVAELRRLAHDEVAVGRIGDRSVDELTHAHGVHHRRHLPRVARQRLKAVEVLRQELAGELAGNAARSEERRGGKECVSTCRSGG